MNLTKAALQKEISFKTSRSGGKGGQNVNKVSSKVELLFDLAASILLSAAEKDLIHSKLGNRLNKDGLIQVICDQERSQFLNKEIAVERLISILGHALLKPKIRKPTKVTRAAKAERLADKKKQSTRKENRKINFTD